jgi:hypothetical protein
MNFTLENVAIFWKENPVAIVTMLEKHRLHSLRGSSLRKDYDWHYSADKMVARANEKIAGIRNGLNFKDKAKMAEMVLNETKSEKKELYKELIIRGSYKNSLSQIDLQELHKIIYDKLKSDTGELNGKMAYSLIISLRAMENAMKVKGRLK